jgi:hypothetical protein
MKRIATSAALLALALAACQQEDPNNIAIDEGNGQDAVIETLPPDETPTNDAASNEGAANESAPDDIDSAAASIPGQYHGRWGMVAADCTSTRGDNKGLITIGDKTIKFYEAVATLKEQRPAIATSFSGLFGFTGEGQSWEKVMTFTRTGNTLKRAENEGTFTYTRCA